jgi:hypothetical protein
MVGLPSYESNDPASVGSGVFSLTVCDSANAFGLAPAAAPGNAQSTDGDVVLIQVLSGPYASFTFAGTVAHGNIVMH